MTSYAALPANAAILDANGQASQAWRAFFRSIASDASRVGDYLQTARGDPGNGWLLCDGSAVAQSGYPALFALLKSITAPGGSPGTFRLPSIPAVYDSASPGPNGTPVMQTWIKAL